MIEHYIIVNRDSTPEKIIIYAWSKIPLKVGHRFNKDGIKGTAVKSEYIKEERGYHIYCLTVIPSGYIC